MADALILNRLFQHLFSNGVVCISFNLLILKQIAILFLFNDFVPACGDFSIDLGPCLHFQSCSRPALWGRIAARPFLTFHWNTEGNMMGSFLNFLLFNFSLINWLVVADVSYVTLRKERCVIHEISSSTDYRKMGSVSFAFPRLINAPIILISNNCTWCRRTMVSILLETRVDFLKRNSISW